MKSFLNKIRRSLREGAKDLYYFGFIIALTRIRYIWQDESGSSLEKRNHAILHYLGKKYGLLLDKYRNYTCNNLGSYSLDIAPIWIFWWQGEESMPEIIQLCQNSVKQSAGNHPIILLTQDNIKEYVELPVNIWDSFYSGNICIQHLADVIRVCLIHRYGGLWLDASIYCHKEIPEEIFDYPFYSLKGECLPQFVSQNRWTTFLLGGQPGNVLCAFLKDFLLTYCESGKPFIDYYMLDCAIALAYNHIPQVAKLIDDLPVSTGDFYWLNQIISCKCDEQLIREINEEGSVFYKLFWKKIGNHHDKDSIFYYLLNN